MAPAGHKKILHAIEPPSGNCFSYFPPRRLEDNYLDGLITLHPEATIQKILLTSWVVKGKFASPRWPNFLSRIEDLHLKSAQNDRFSHPLTSGRNLAGTPQYIGGCSGYLMVAISFQPRNRPNHPHFFKE